MSGLRERTRRRDCPSTSSMDDWYLEVCKRNVDKLVIRADMPETRGLAQRDARKGVRFLTEDTNNARFDTLTGSGSSNTYSSRKSPEQWKARSPPSDANVSSGQLHPDTMKKMHTDPRILTGQKGASTLTQWYDHEIVGVSSEDQQSYSSCPDVNSPDSGQNQSRMCHLQVPDGNHLTPENVIRDRLLSKINRTNEQLISEQNAKQLNVNEYLRLSSNISPMERARAQRVKAAFERRNQKSTAVVAQLQRKLESYKQRLHEIEASGGGGGGMANVSPWQAFDLLRGIRDSVSTNLRSGISGFSGTIVTKPRVLAHMIRNKFGSADNISAMRDIDDEEVMEQNTSPSHGRIGSTLPASFRCYSDEDLSKLGITSPPLSRVHAASTPLQVVPPSSSLQNAASRRQNARLAPSGMADDDSDELDVLSALESVQISRDILHRQMDEVAELKSHLAANRQKWKEEIEFEKARCEQLIERLNDLSDVHQDELIAIKQELSVFEEKLAYQLDERMRDMHEMVDNCHNRLAKLEAIQHRTTVEGIDNSYVRGYVVKLINIALSFLALLLIVLSFVINFLHPFISSRSRLLVTSVCIVVVAAAWFNWHSLTASLHRRL